MSHDSVICPMAFPEALKLEIKKRAHFQCCLCHALGVEIHHIIPESENGPATAENAAPLCPTCHEIYGANPEKRKFIREARDFWYELCEKRFFLDSQQLHAISEKLKDVATKEDLERLAVRDYAYVLGQPLAGSTLPWEHLRYSFVREEYIHPLIVRELLGWLSDQSETVVAIDLGQANRSNRFYGEFSGRKQEGRLWVQWDDQRESFAYSHVATSPSGVHMVECYDSGGGSGVFGWVALLALDCDRSLGEEPVGTLHTRERVLLKTLGSISLGDRYNGEIKYSDGLLKIGPDQGWFGRGEEASRTIPVR